MTDNSHNGSTKPLLLDNTIGISSNDVVVVAEGGGYGSVVVVHLDDDDDGWEALHHHHHHDTAATNSSSGGSVGQVIAGMTKNLIGCGALSLSNGLALFYTPKTSLALCIVVACLTIYGMAVIFGYYCWLIGSICATTKQSTYRAIWDTSLQRLRNSNTTSNDCSNGSSTTTTKATTAASSIPSSNDNGSAIFVAISNTLKASLATLAYSSILTDTVLKLLESLYGPSSSNHRTQCLLVITITTLLPLCLFRNIQFLAPCSIIGTLGIVMTTMIMLLRSIDGTYDANGGIYYRDLPPQYQPSFYTTTNTTDTNSTNEHQSSSSLWSSSSLAILPFVCMVYEAYVMHYNSPRFYREIRDTNLQKYQVVVSTSFGISAVLYSGIAVFGFLTFGAHSDGFILNNYSPQDPLATFCRMAVGVSTLAAYPIVFIGVRDGVLDLMNVSMEQQTTRQLNIITIVLLTVVTVISIFIHDLGLINSIGGGLVATMIVFVFPTIMFYAVTRSEQQKLQEQQQYANCTETTKMIELSGPSDTDDCATTTSTMRRHENQLIVTIGLAVIGVILGIIGAYIAVQMAEMKQ